MKPAFINSIQPRSIGEAGQGNWCLTEISAWDFLPGNSEPSHVSSKTIKPKTSAFLWFSDLYLTLETLNAKQNSKSTEQMPIVLKNFTWGTYVVLNQLVGVSLLVRDNFQQPSLLCLSRSIWLGGYSVILLITVGSLANSLSHPPKSSLATLGRKG